MEMMSNYGINSQFHGSEQVIIMENILDHLNSSPENEITAKLIGQDTKTPYIHVSHDQWQNCSDIPYGPSFYLVLRIIKDEIKSHNREILQIQMATYSGRLLQSSGICGEKLELNENVGSNVISSQIFAHFVRGDIGLCKGLLKSAKKHPGEDPETLREFIGDRIVTRSRQCTYAVLKTADMSDGQNCQNCKNFMPTCFNEKRIKRQQSDSDTNIKSESEDIDDFDDYGNNEFLDNDDIQVVSIVEALPQKLTKLAGITLIRNTGPSENSEKKALPGPAPKKQRISNDENEDHQDSSENFPEPHVNLTVIKETGRQKKSVPFNDFRKEIDIEQARQLIREPTLTKKRKPPMVNEDQPLSEKRPKRAAARKPAIVEDDPDFSPDNKKSGAGPKLLVRKATPKATPKPKPEAPKIPQKHQVKNCPLCDKPFSDISEFMKHLTTCDPVDSGPSGDEGEIFATIYNSNKFSLHSGQKSRCPSEK